jgi:hypothetical protein
VARAWLPPLALLLAYGVAFAARALGTGLLVFDDHPGQIYRLWHVTTRGPAPWAWNPGWWTGYPELQFYPPGFAYAGALLHLGTLGAVSIETAYRTLLWLAYLLPGLTAFLALARLTGSGWLALPGALLALAFAGGTSGVEGGVRTGMVGARLAWALIPLLLLLLLPWIADGRRRPWLAVPVVAAIVLLHPAELPAAVVLLALAALVAAPRLARLVTAGVVLALAAAVTAFWWLPLLFRLAHTRALAWGEAPSLGGFGALLALVALLAFLRARAAGPAALVVALFPWAMAMVTLLDRGVLEPLGLRWLPANRVVDGAWIALILAAGLGWSRLQGFAFRRSPVLLGLGGVALLVAVSARPATLALWPRPLDWPNFERIERGLRIWNLWNALHWVPEGRVLFVRSGVPLVHGPEWWRAHSHITAITPITAGRAIVNGTFTHSSPVAALVYLGDAGPGPITQLVEQLDGVSLFGRPLAALDAATFDRLAERLAVSTVVVLDLDLPQARWLDDNPDWVQRFATGPFLVYLRRAPLPVPPPREVAPGRWRVTLAGAPGDWAPARVAYYPLWRAEVGGAALETRRGELGDLEVRLTRTGPVDLLYRPGAPEYAGVGVSLVGLAVGLALAWRGRDLR